MNLVVVQVAMCLVWMVGVAVEAPQAAIGDSEESSWPALLVAEPVWESARLPGAALRPWTGSVGVVQCSRFLQVYNLSGLVMRAIQLVGHSSHRRREVRAVKRHVRNSSGTRVGLDETSARGNTKKKFGQVFENIVQGLVVRSSITHSSVRG